MREFAYFGTDVLAAESENRSQLQELQLQALQLLQVKLVRFHASHHRFTTPQSIDKIRVALRKLNDSRMQAIICLDAANFESGFFVAGNRDIPRGESGHYRSVYYRDKLYRMSYLPTVEAIVREFAQDRTVAIWELGSAPQFDETAEFARLDAEAYYEFASEVSRRVKDLAPQQAVSLGLSTVRHVLSWEGDADPIAQARRLYTLPTIDVVSVQLRAEEGERALRWREEYDLAVAQVVNKPIYVGELGARADLPPDYRFQFYQDQMVRWKELGAFSTLLTQFNESRQDLGISDGVARAQGDSWFERVKSLLGEHGTPANPIVTRSSRPRGEAARRGQRSEPPPFRYFRVLRNGLVVYAEPSVRASRQPKTLQSNEVLKVETKSRLEKEGFVWWAYEDGWVIERAAQAKVKRLQVLLQEVTAETLFASGYQEMPPQSKPVLLRFRVTNQRSGSIPVRKRPAKNARIVGSLNSGEEVEVFADSRREVNGMIWWQHLGGWSAERPVRSSPSDSRIAMELVGPVEDLPNGVGGAPAARFLALTTLNVRQALTSLDDNVIGLVLEGDVIDANGNSRTLNYDDGYVWWLHQQGRDLEGGAAGQSGWTAERGIDGTPVYLEPAALPSDGPTLRRFITDPDDPFDVNDPQVLPGRDTLFYRLPLGNKHWLWVQHFGNTSFARFVQGDYYKQSCLLHGGLDLGNNRLKDWNEPSHRVPVAAGIEGGVVQAIDTRTLRPASVTLKVTHGGVTYEVIYGHLHPNIEVAVGDEVWPDTVLGYVATHDLLRSLTTWPNPHVHLEIRYRGYLLNPLLFIPNGLRERVAANQPDLNRYPHFFPYHKWQTPFDQPVIKRGGEPMGPRVE